MQAKSLTGEVIIQCEGVRETVAAHQLEARAIDQRQPSAVGGEQRGYRRRVQFFVDPDWPNHRNEDVGQGSQRFQAEAALYERERLDQHIVRSNEGPRFGNRSIQCVDYVAVPRLVRVQKREKRRRIDEETHESKASSR